MARTKQTARKTAVVDAEGSAVRPPSTPPRATPHVEVVRDARTMREWSRERRYGGGETVGFVPTMGSLHQGHLALVEEAKRRADRVVVSIYVNPSQFAPNEDFDEYPRSVESDLAKLRGLRVDAVFLPRNLYGGGDREGGEKEQAEKKRRVGESASGSGGPSAGQHQTWVAVSDLQKPLCGVSRPHFFSGVATVVAKLFHIVEPTCAFFGQKDYQQLRVIQTMVKELDFDVEVVGLPIVRESDGLAMSSRNELLSPQDRRNATNISRGLGVVKNAFHRPPTGLEADARAALDPNTLVQCVKDLILEAGGRVDYVTIADAETLEPVTRLDGKSKSYLVAVAAFFGKVRLIDNTVLGHGETCWL